MFKHWLNELILVRDFGKLSLGTDIEKDFVLYFKTIDTWFIEVHKFDTDCNTEEW